MNTRLTNIESSVVVGQRWIIGIQFTTLIVQFLDSSRPDWNIDGRDPLHIFLVHSLSQ